MSKWLEIQKCIDEEAQRQEDEICLIASENYMSRDVLDACGSKLINKYAEGYSGHRYYGGCSVVDKVEDLANECARKLFNCKWSNVQPNSGCQANQAVYMALLKPGDTILAMDINSGGHISHSLSIGFAGTFYNVVSYGLDENGYLNYDEIKEKLYEYKPKLLIVGASAYPRIIDFERIRKIVDEYNSTIVNQQKDLFIEWLLKLGFIRNTFSGDYTFTSKNKKVVINLSVGIYNNEVHSCASTKGILDNNQAGCSGDMNINQAIDEVISIIKHYSEIQDIVIPNFDITKCYLMVDMARIAGLVAAGLHPSPLPYADVVTSTVQKTLRSGRGGLILSNDEELGKKIDKAIFPRLQGGPLMNMIAGKAVGFSEALETLFVKYQKQVLTNVQAMVKVFNENGIKMITGGSDNHLILLDLRDEPFSGAMLEQVLEKQGIIVNKNAVQNDPKPKMETSGVRIGTAAITTRNAVKQDAHDIAVLITSNIKYLRNGGIPDDFFDSSRKWVKDWCKKHPIYPDYD